MDPELIQTWVDLLQNPIAWALVILVAALRGVVEFGISVRKREDLYQSRIADLLSENSELRGSVDRLTSVVEQLAAREDG